VQDGQLGRLLAEDADIPFVELGKENIDEEVFRLIPERVARKKRVVAFGRDEDGIRLAMVDPTDLETIHSINKRVNDKIKPYLATKRDLESALNGYKENLKDEFQKILKSLKRSSLTRDERDQLTVTIVDTLLNYAYRSHVSDIHIEPYEQRVVVRFRIDGVMHDALDLPKELHEYIVTRIKILAKLQTDQQKSPQDGKFRFNINDEFIDVRVSVVPVIKGENIVMRILAAYAGGFTLNSLGMSDNQFKLITHAIENPHGMILVVGPTGSGKTTTVYAMLKILNTKEVHISSIEDPVEYDIPGVSQIQVDQKTGLLFANGLRAIVRQDPDIIFVGEIRDKETAGISINAALTGHLVLSTLHANDSSTTLHRFLDMGIEPFLVATTINVVIGQRLVRKICTACRESYQLSDKADNSKELLAKKELLEVNPQFNKVLKKKGYARMDDIHLYKGSGCDVCSRTGYSGRIGIFEVLHLTDSIKELIMKRAHHDEISAMAVKEGMATMFENGIDAVLNGVTTVEEVLRVIYE
jgi:type IV pilus assembly protein PilB